MTSQLTKPLLSVITPTLNSSQVLESCLKSVKNQSFTNYEIIICDGGSTDNSLKIAKKYSAKVIKNRLKTAEAGKALALKHALGKFVLLLDSDNILPTKHWLKNALAPMLHNRFITGTEPISFTYRKNSGFIERYCSLFGANDPYAWFTGNIDKINYLDCSWPFPELVLKNYPQYILLKLSKNLPIPTIGANGTVFLTKFLTKYQKGDFLFDIDILINSLTDKSILFAKTKNSITHTYCESSIKKFIAKQNRRITDFFQYSHLRNTNWQKVGLIKNILFLIYSCSIILPIITALKGYKNKPDFAWFFHPLACLLTSLIYSQAIINHKLHIMSYVSRNNWRQ